MTRPRDPRAPWERLGPLMAYVALVGLLVFAIRRQRPASPYLVVVSQAEIDARIRGEEELRGRALSREERSAFARQVVEDAVLLREAERRRLDRDDPLIRSTLLGHVWSELAGDVPMPTEGEARAWYAANPERYSRPATISIVQAVFASAAEAPPSADVLAALEGGAEPETFGTVFRVPHRTSNSTRAELVSVYGASFADAVLAIDDDRWHGPIASTLATHYVRVTQRQARRPRAYEEVASYVQEDVRRDRMQEVVGQLMPAIRARYDVRIEGGSR